MGREQGFIMADTLIALLITSLAITSLLGLNQQTLDLAASRSAKLNAALLARALIEDEMLQGETGSIKIDGQNYTWARETRERQRSPRDKARIFDTRITIEWDGKRSERTLTVQSTRMRGAHED